MANSMQLSDVLFVVGATGDGRAKDHRKPPAFRSRSVDPKEMYVFFFFFEHHIYIYIQRLYIYIICILYIYVHCIMMYLCIYICALYYVHTYILYYSKPEIDRQGVNLEM